MNFFEIRKYSVRNFNLVQKNYISLPLIPVSLSQDTGYQSFNILI